MVLRCLSAIYLYENRLNGTIPVNLTILAKLE